MSSSLYVPVRTLDPSAVLHYCIPLHHISFTHALILQPSFITHPSTSHGVHCIPSLAGTIIMNIHISRAHVTGSTDAITPPELLAAIQDWLTNVGVLLYTYDGRI